MAKTIVTCEECGAAVTMPVFRCPTCQSWVLDAQSTVLVAIGVIALLVVGVWQGWAAIVQWSLMGALR